MNLQTFKEELKSKFTRFFSNTQKDGVIDFEQIVDAFSNFLTENMSMEAINPDSLLDSIETVVNAAENNFSNESTEKFLIYNYMQVPIEGSDIFVRCYFKGKKGMYDIPSIKFYKNENEHSFLQFKQDKNDPNFHVFAEYKIGDYTDKKKDYIQIRHSFSAEPKTNGLNSEYRASKKFNKKKGDLKVPFDELSQLLSDDRKKFFENLFYLMKLTKNDCNGLYFDDANLIFGDFYDKVSSNLIHSGELSFSEIMRFVIESTFHKDGKSFVSDLILAEGDDPTCFSTELGEKLKMKTLSGENLDINDSNGNDFLPYTAFNEKDEPVAKYMVLPLDEGFTIFKSGCVLNDKDPSFTFNISFQEDEKTHKKFFTLNTKFLQGKNITKDCLLKVYNDGGSFFINSERNKATSGKSGMENLAQAGMLNLDSEEIIELQNEEINQFGN